MSAPDAVIEPIHIVQIERRAFLALTHDAAMGKRLQNHARERDYQERLRGPRQHLSVPNNRWGRFVLWLFKRYMNHVSYKLTYKGRSPRDGKHTTSIPIHNARRLGVYIDARKRPTRKGDR